MNPLRRRIVQSRGRLAGWDQQQFRALTCKYNAQLSCGRVQTPTLAMIAPREERIRAFAVETLLWNESQGSGDFLYLAG